MQWSEKFNEQKNKARKRWRKHKENEKVDKEVINIVKKINSKKNHFTTSSCAGRIAIMTIPKPGKKGDAEFIKKWHQPINYATLDKTIQDTEKEDLWIISQPPIFHIGSRTIEDAYNVTKIGIQSGFKNTGIRSITNKKIITEILSTERIDVPYAPELPENYLKDLTEKLNYNLKSSRNKMKDLESDLEKLE